MSELMSFKSDQFSQNGEDGLLAQIFERLGITRCTFCEFGAWDGQHLSNTFALYKSGWSGVYIEGDETRFRDLLANVSEPAECVCAFVGTHGPDKLDAILSRSKTFSDTRSIDLLSVDIDSDDLAVWQALELYRAKVVVIEFNPTIPIDVFFTNPKGHVWGNSARAIYEHGLNKEYVLVATTASNLIFVAREIAAPFEALSLFDPELTLGQRYFFGMDGTLIMQPVGKGAALSAPEIHRVPWNNARFGQPVDKPFRRYDPGKGLRALGRRWSYFKLVFTKPGTMMARVLRG